MVGSACVYGVQSQVGIGGVIEVTASHQASIFQWSLGKLAEKATILSKRSFSWKTFSCIG